VREAADEMEKIKEGEVAEEKAENPPPDGEKKDDVIEGETPGPPE